MLGQVPEKSFGGKNSKIIWRIKVAEKIKKSDYNQRESLLAELEGVIGYRFENKEYLNEALSHSSYVN